MFQYEKELYSPLGFLRLDKDFIVVDRSHQITLDEFNKLLTLSEKSRAKLVFINNVRGLLGSSNILSLCEKAGIESKSIDTGGHRHPIYVGLASQSHKLSISSDDTLVIADSKGRIKALTQEIRNELKYEGRLEREEFILNTLNPIYVDDTRMSTADFKKGDLIRIYQNHLPYEDFIIRGGIKNEGVLSLERLSGATERIKLNILRKHKFRVFEQAEVKLAVGDKVKGTATMEKIGIVSGHQYKVSNITEKHLELLGGGKLISISTNNTTYLPLTYDYVRPISQAAGHFDKVILDAKSYRISSNLIHERIS